MYIGLIAVPTCAQKPSAEEQLFFDSANRERVAQGLHALKWDESLAVAARRHAALMSSEAELSHQLPGELALDQRAAQAGARFSKVGENIAVGPEAPQIHTGWMHSPGHRANILDTNFTALGVGVVRLDGEFYAVEDFSVWVENLGIDAQEQKVAALLSARGLRVTGDKADARQVCADEGGSQERVAGAHSKMAILRYEAPDIDKFPEQMEAILRQGKYHRAAVGACIPKVMERGIPKFRIAIVLF